MIHLCLEIPDEFVHLILQEGFWVMHIPFVRKFPEDPLYNHHYYFLLLVKLTVFNWSLNDCKSPQGSGNLRRILADLNNAEFLIVFIYPSIFFSQSFRNRSNINYYFCQPSTFFYVPYKGAIICLFFREHSTHLANAPVTRLLFSAMVREIGVQSQIKSYKRFLKWYLMPPCLTLSITR